QPQVNASKLAYNLENCEDSSQSESCGIEELKSNQHDEVITKLEKNIIVEQELKQQLLSPAHTSRSDQTSEEQDPSLDTTQNIVCMFKKANKLGQEAILYWCYFIEKYDKRIDNFVAGGVKKKTATSMVYQEIKQLLPEITDILHDQSHVTSKINPTNTYIPLKAPQSKPTYDQSYFRSKTLDQYPNLYKECSDGNVDYYGITDNISFPLCRLDHDDIEGEYKDGTYYIKSKSDKVLTPEYLDWYSKLTDLPTMISDKLHSKLYKIYKEKTRLNPWIKSETSESPQSEMLIIISYKTVH
ncbi:11272_t:CDS:2, partial [Entrophospora sp. SA101]